MYIHKTLSNTQRASESVWSIGILLDEIFAETSNVGTRLDGLWNSLLRVQENRSKRHFMDVIQSGILVWDHQLYLDV